MQSQPELPFRSWGGARKGSGRKPRRARAGVPHRRRPRFRRGTAHVTLRVRQEVWNLRSHRCFRSLRRAFAGGCARFGFRLIHFSVMGNHIHCIVESPDAIALGRAMKGLEVRMARALNKVMSRRGPVFDDRYHAHLLTRVQEAAYALRYVLENRRVHALRAGAPAPEGIDPCSSDAWREHWPPLVVDPGYWLLRVGVEFREFSMVA